MWTPNIGKGYPVALGLVEKCCEIDSINFDRKRKFIILTRFFKLIASHKVSSFTRNNLNLLDFKDATQSGVLGCGSIVVLLTNWFLPLSCWKSIGHPCNILSVHLLVFPFSCLNRACIEWKTRQNNGINYTFSSTYISAHTLMDCGTDAADRKKGEMYEFYQQWTPIHSLLVFLTHILSTPSMRMEFIEFLYNLWNRMTQSWASFPGHGTSEVFCDSP